MFIRLFSYTQKYSESKSLSCRFITIIKWDWYRLYICIDFVRLKKNSLNIYAAKRSRPASDFSILRIRFDNDDRSKNNAHGKSILTL